jgi:hypothetical protein
MLGDKEKPKIKIKNKIKISALGPIVDKHWRKLTRRAKERNTV